ncbi:hypothetical protein ACJX0J_021787, partial [Zea mays]
KFLEIIITSIDKVKGLKYLFGSRVSGDLGLGYINSTRVLYFLMYSINIAHFFLWLIDCFSATAYYPSALGVSLEYATGKVLGEASQGLSHHVRVNILAYSLHSILLKLDTMRYQHLEKPSAYLDRDHVAFYMVCLVHYISYFLILLHDFYGNCLVHSHTSYTLTQLHVLTSHIYN